MIRVRFAPSPTGVPHVGNIRTAIFNWLFAKKNHGKFFIRMEDTDINRSKQEYKDKIFEILKWFNLDYEKDIIIQSERFELYLSYAQKLIGKFAFYCKCFDEICECAEKCYRDGAIRFLTPKNKIIKFTDIILGDLSINSNTLENFMLVRSDGIPTYMLCVVIDDYLMNISHVIRGEDHKTNTFKQILLYEAFSFSIPQFAHLPMIIGDDRKKLSKRNGDVSITYYIEQGYLSDALFNFLLKLGWGYKDEEIIYRNRALELFDLKNVRRSPSLFDLKKLKHFSAHYIKNTDIYYIAYDFFQKHMKNKFNLIITEDYFKAFFPLYRQRSSTLLELSESLEFLYMDKIYSDQNINLNKIIINKINNNNYIFTKEEQDYFRGIISPNKYLPSIEIMIEKMGKESLIKRINYTNEK